MAVLNVPDLRAPVLDFAGDAPSGAPAVVAGNPGGGNLDVREATIADRSQGYGQDAGGGFVSRDAYTTRVLVRPGNSGGPLLTPEGQVYGAFARSVNDPS